jgi:hypothetical protein
MQIKQMSILESLSIPVVSSSGKEAIDLKYSVSEEELFGDDM